MKKYILTLFNGDSYEDQQSEVIGIFSTRQKAQDAERKVKTHLEKVYNTS